MHTKSSFHENILDRYRLLSGIQRIKLSNLIQASTIILHICKFAHTTLNDIFTISGETLLAFHVHFNFFNINFTLTLWLAWLTIMTRSMSKTLLHWLWLKLYIFMIIQGANDLSWCTSWWTRCLVFRKIQLPQTSEFLMSILSLKSNISK